MKGNEVTSFNLINVKNATIQEDVASVTISTIVRPAVPGFVWQKPTLYISGQHLAYKITVDLDKLNHHGAKFVTEILLEIGKPLHH